MTVFQYDYTFGFAHGQFFPGVQHWFVLGHRQSRREVTFEGVAEDDGCQAPYPGYDTKRESPRVETPPFSMKNVVRYLLLAPRRNHSYDRLALIDEHQRDVVQVHQKT